MTSIKSPAVVDFLERVGATAFEAGAAVYIADPKAGTAKAAGIAALIAAVKYAYLKVGAWQAAHTDVQPTPQPVGLPVPEGAR